MKPLLIILKTLIIGYLWSIVFIDGIRVLLLVNWHFDIFLREHWRLLSDKWNSGAPISRSEFAFFLILVSSIPLWVAGWIGLCLIKWDRFFKKLFMWPVYLYKKLTLKKKPPIVIKKKSVTEETKTTSKASVAKKVPVKKVGLPSATLMQSNVNNNMSSSMRPTSNYIAASKKNPEAPTTHALFNFDDDDFDLDFDLDKKTPEKEDYGIPSALKVDEPQPKEKAKDSADSIISNFDTNFLENKPKNNNHKDNQSKPKSTPAPARESHTPILDILKQKGYDIIPFAVIKNTTIDYIAVSKQQLILCLVDKEIGDWLADEEKFNDEEPLWFSESSHRISPVRKIDVARDILRTKLIAADMNFEIVSYVIIQSGNIINAEDMFEIWSEMNINVTRINRGSPKEIRLFSKSLENCEDKIDKNIFEKLKKLIRSLA